MFVDLRWASGGQSNFHCSLGWVLHGPSLPAQLPVIGLHQLYSCHTPVEEWAWLNILCLMYALCVHGLGGPLVLLHPPS